MAHDRMTALFFELFSGLPRQGPGDTTSTLRALSCMPTVTADTRVLDLGCGTGFQTRVLAEHAPGRILGIDNHPPFIDAVNGEARRLGLANRLEGRVGDITKLDLPVESFDVIWSEAAIYVLGFERGLREWRRLLRPGGHLAVTEACWIKADPPDECVAFWKQEYPAMRDASALLSIARACDYAVVEHFMLPPSSWWDHYYRPLEVNISEFRARHEGERDAQELADQTQREIDVWKEYSDYYGYVFFVMKRS